MMILRNESCYGNTSNDYNFFMQNLKSITPLKTISIYFDDENFLLTDYDARIGTTFIAEGWNNTQIHLTGLNCGYGGTGPSGTMEALKKVGVLESIAEKVKYFPGVQLYFNKDGIFLEDKTTYNTFFSSQNYNGAKLQLNQYTYVEYETQSLFFINPQIHNPLGIYAAIDRLKPLEFQYYIGNTSPLNGYYTPNTIGNHKSIWHEVNNGITGINLALTCPQMDIYFLIDKKISRSFINMIYYYIYGKPLFDDGQYGSKPYFMQYVWQYIKNKDNAKELSGTFSIDRWRKENEMD